MLNRKPKSVLRLVPDQLNQTFPNEITGTYSLDYDIVYGNKIVLHWIQTNKSLKETYEKEIEKIKSRIETLKSLVEIQLETIRLNDLQNVHKSILENEKRYIEKSPNILAEYTKCKKPPPMIQGKQITLTTEDHQRLDIIEEWIRLAKKIMPVSLVHETPVKSSGCVMCGNPLVHESFGRYCRQCGVVESYFDVDGEEDTSDTPKKKDYDLVANFMKIVERHCGCGTQARKVPIEKIKEDVTGYCRTYKISIETLTKPKLKEILKITGNNDYYGDVNLIHSCLCGSSLPTVNHNKEIYEKWYIEYLDVFQRMPKDRQSAINGQYLLYKLQELITGTTPQRDEFNITENESTLEKYEAIWRYVCETKNWPFFSILDPTIRNDCSSESSDMDPTRFFIIQ